MSDINYSSDGEFETAVAAATSAVISQEGENSLNQKRSDEKLRSPTKTKSKREERTGNPSDYSRWFSGKDAKGGTSAGESSMRKRVTLGQLFLEDSAAFGKVPKRAMGTEPSVKKTPSFSDKYLNDTDSKRFEHGQVSKTGQPAASTMKPKASSSSSGRWDGNTINSSKAETKADAWEKEKMAKIKKRYEKLITTILERENDKKMKAKRWMERTEREIGLKRARDLKEFRDEISRIDKIANGARAIANEGKRKDEYKTIEKAKKKKRQVEDNREGKGLKNQPEKFPKNASAAE